MFLKELAMPDLDLIKQAEQGCAMGAGGFLRVNGIKKFLKVKYLCGDDPWCWFGVP